VICALRAMGACAMRMRCACAIAHAVCVCMYEWGHNMLYRHRVCASRSQQRPDRTTPAAAGGQFLLSSSKLTKGGADSLFQRSPKSSAPGLSGSKVPNHYSSQRKSEAARRIPKRGQSSTYLMQVKRYCVLLVAMMMCQTDAFMYRPKTGLTWDPSCMTWNNKTYCKLYSRLRV
jgi:hypothetical protein